jgi:hypothetical protein
MPKSALGGAPGAGNSGGGQNNGQGGQGGRGINRTTRRAFNRVLAAVQSGNTQEAARLIQQFTSQAQAQATGGQQGGGQNQNRNQNQSQQAQQGRRVNLLSQNLSQQNITELFRTMQGSDATRAETYGFIVLLHLLREEDATTLTAPDIFNLCRQSAIAGLTYLTMTRPLTGAQQSQRTQNQNQQQNQQRNQGQQTGQNRTSSGNRNRNRNRRGAPVTV